jgi:hypothetical protein
MPCFLLAIVLHMQADVLHHTPALSSPVLLLLPQYLVDKLSSVLDSRASSSPDVAAAGMVVNTMGYVDGLGYELLLHAIKSLKVCANCHKNVTCYLGSDVSVFLLFVADMCLAFALACCPNLFSCV